MLCNFKLHFKVDFKPICQFLNDDEFTWYKRSKGLHVWVHIIFQASFQCSLLAHMPRLNEEGFTWFERRVVVPRRVHMWCQAFLWVHMWSLHEDGFTYLERREVAIVHHHVCKSSMWIVDVYNLRVKNGSHDLNEKRLFIYECMWYSKVHAKLQPKFLNEDENICFEWKELIHLWVSMWFEVSRKVHKPIFMSSHEIQMKRSHSFPNEYMIIVINSSLQAKCK